MTTLTRRQLYDLIWSKPMRDAAAEIGISDVGLRKVCERHRVPVPPQGYWNKVHAGQRPPKALFREVNDPAVNRVVIQGSRYRPPPEVEQVLVAAQALERQPDHRIAVPPAGPPSLPAAVRLAAALKKARTDERGLTDVTGRRLFRVRVASATVDRAVTLVEALLTGALKRGFAVTSGAAHLTIVVDGEPLVLGLTEAIRRSDHKRTEEEYDREERRQQAIQRGNWDLASRLHQSEPRWDYQRLGQLALEMEEKEYLSVRSRWSDTKTRKLETMLNDVLAGLVAYAAARKQRAEELARWKRKRELERQRAEDARRLAEVEQVRVKFLGERLGAWRELGELSALLAGLAQSAAPPADGALAVFIAWAEKRLEQLRWECEPDGLQAYVEHSALFAPPAAAGEGLNPDLS